MPRATKAALAAPNVVALPTAAPRQVRQNYNRAAAAERQKLRDETPWPGEFLYPSQREALRKAAVLREVEQTPALAIAMAIYTTLEDDARLKVLGLLAAPAVAGHQWAAQAVATLQTTRMTVGEQVDQNFAMRRLDGEGR